MKAPSTSPLEMRLVPESSGTEISNEAEKSTAHGYAPLCPRDSIRKDYSIDDFWRHDNTMTPRDDSFVKGFPRTLAWWLPMNSRICNVIIIVSILDLFVVVNDIFIGADQTSSNATYTTDLRKIACLGSAPPACFPSELRVNQTIAIGFNCRVAAFFQVATFNPAIIYLPLVMKYATKPLRTTFEKMLSIPRNKPKSLVYKVNLINFFCLSAAVGWYLWNLHFYLRLDYSGLEAWRPVYYIAIRSLIGTFMGFVTGGVTSYYILMMQAMDTTYSYCVERILRGDFQTADMIMGVLIFVQDFLMEFNPLVSRIVAPSCTLSVFGMISALLQLWQGTDLWALYAGEVAFGTTVIYLGVFKVAKINTHGPRLAHALLRQRDSSLDYKKRHELRNFITEQDEPCQVCGLAIHMRLFGKVAGLIATSIAATLVKSMSSISKSVNEVSRAGR